MSDYHRRLGRPVQVIAALATGFGAVVALGLGALGAYRLSTAEPDGVFVVFTALCWLAGVGLVSVTWRLATGRERETGGLLSPMALRAGGVGLAALGVAAPFLDLGWDKAIGGVLAGIGAFALAARRDPQRSSSSTPRL